MLPWCLRHAQHSNVRDLYRQCIKPPSQRLCCHPMALKDAWILLWAIRDKEVCSHVKVTT